MKYDLIAIGGGAAGLTAAGFALRRGKKVLVIDKNTRPARKILLTGKGRCNLTNACTLDELIKSIPTNPRFLYSALSAFTPYDTMELFEALGVPLKTERGNRVFPVSDKAMDIVDALSKFAHDADYVQGEVVRVLTTDGAVRGVELSGGERYEGKSVLIATGGKSYPLTGSTGAGYKLAQDLGHSISPCVPSLVPIVSPDKFCREMQGLSLKNVSLRVTDEKRDCVMFSDFGEMLFTHFGMSGPLVLSASAMLRPMESGRYLFHIDLKSALDHEKLDARILRDFSEMQNRELKNSLSKLLPASIINPVIQKSGISPEMKINQLTRADRLKLGAVIKDFTVRVSEFRPIEEAIITSGGVSVKELSPKTLESKIVKNLFFAGEVIDVDAFTGGFNLQIAFSTGYLAGNAV